MGKPTACHRIMANQGVIGWEGCEDFKAMLYASLQELQAEVEAGILR